MKTYQMLLYLWLAAAFFITSCCTKDNPMKENPTPAELIAGFYEAIKWTDIGVGDWQVDMLARGSSLTVQLTSDLKVSGHLFVPANSGSRWPAQDIDYAGTFILDVDTVRFQDTVSLDGPFYTFLVKGDSLATVDQDGPNAVFKIILERSK